MDILGISCYFHDASAVLLRDGVPVACAAEESFTRRKHDFRFPEHAIRYVLEAGGVRGPDLEWVVFYEKPFRKWERLWMSVLGMYPRSWPAFREAVQGWLADKLWVKARLQQMLGVAPDRILFSDHHLSHAASAFFCSPFDEAAILTADAVGEWSTATLSVGRDRRIEAIAELRFPHSIGLLYSTFTAFLGFEVNEGEYKVMGMAPFGEPRYVEDIYRLLDLKPDGSLWLDMDYFSYPYSSDRMFRSRLEKLLGPPRKPGMPFFTRRSGWPAYFGERPPDWERLADENQRYADIAASIQRVTEDILLAMARYLYERTGLRRLCMAGGVALNCVANARILQEGPFEEIFIQPNAGDGGGALGAALWVYHTVLGHPRKFVMEHAYWGRAYTTGEVRAALERAGVPFEEAPDEETLVDRTVEYLLEGRVVGWFQGRLEWGPRALGHRSILADPRRPDMKDRVNVLIKFREPYRPFAPSVAAEAAARFFDGGPAIEQYPARFMLYTVPVRSSAVDRIPAVTHVDGSARIQTVTAAWEPLYDRLIRRFGEATGVPVVLNTSFNLKGEPIVCSPADALSTFFRSGLEVLVIDRFIVEKRDRVPENASAAVARVAR